MSVASDPKQATQKIGSIFRDNISVIMAQWADSARRRVPIAAEQTEVALYNNLPALLTTIADALSITDSSLASGCSAAITAAAKDHGLQRTQLADFTLEDVIQEYRILRQTIINVVGRNCTISPPEMNVLLEAVDCALTEAATEFASGLGFKRSRIYRDAKQETREAKEELKEAKVELKETKVELKEAKVELKYAKVELKDVSVSFGQLSEQSSGLEQQVKRRTADLTEAIQSRDQFIAVASHELKTPLTSLKMETQLIKRYLQEDDVAALQAPRMKSLIDKADDEIRRLERLISDMLDVSRIRLGKLPLNLEKICLEPLVRGCVDVYRELILEKKLSILVVTRGDACGNWDRNRIEQVVTNLLSNAIKYGAGKPVEILIESSEKMARLSVIDHGIGIAKEDQSRIFERFERVIAAKSITGFGIGLFISKHFVLAHNGSVSVESELGKGAKFVVELPLKASGT